MGREYREEQEVILALKELIVLPSIITAAMDFYSCMLEHSKAIFLSPWG